ncbi:hypothetical protein BDR07DRAFT_1381016 [Suillus spraguei]|nr:hypothetical protein BDR07DRAFT_1381016 [Suillus spraguei]
MALLNFWYAQQETGKDSTFLFKAWKNKDGDMVPSVVSGKSPSPLTRKVRMQKSGTLRRPWDPSTEAESDTDSETHDKEYDIDDDSADARKETEVPCSMPEPRPARPAKAGALLTSQMGDLLAGFTEEVEERNTLLAPRSIQGKKAVIEPSARTTRMSHVPNVESQAPSSGRILITEFWTTPNH